MHQQTAEEVILEALTVAKEVVARMMEAKQLTQGEEVTKGVTEPVVGLLVASQTEG